MQVVWTDPALERVDEIAVHIAQDDPAAAARSYRVFYRVGSAWRCAQPFIPPSERRLGRSGGADHED